MDQSRRSAPRPIDRRALIRRAAAAGAAAWTAPLVLDSLASPAAASTPGATTTYYLSNAADTHATALASLTTVAQSAVIEKEIKADAGTVEAQTDPTKFEAWRTAALAAGLSVTNQNVTLRIFARAKDSGKQNRVEAGLFHCTSLTGNTTSSACTFIASAFVCVTSNVFGEYVISFGPQTFTVPNNSNLRVKVVNRSSGTCASDDDGFARWDNGAAGSRLVIG